MRIAENEPEDVQSNDRDSTQELLIFDSFGDLRTPSEINSMREEERKDAVHLVLMSCLYLRCNALIIE